MKVSTFNHYTIEVRDLQRSLDFYVSILGLLEMIRSNFDFDGAWIDMGENLSLHLVHNPLMVEVIGGSRKLHFAFEVKDIYTYREFLVSKEILIVKDIKHRPGILQLFITDPDGYFIELTQLN